MTDDELKAIFSQFDGVSTIFSKRRRLDECMKSLLSQKKFDEKWDSIDSKYKEYRKMGLMAANKASTAQNTNNVVEINNNEMDQDEDEDAMSPFAGLVSEQNSENEEEAKKGSNELELVEIANNDQNNKSKEKAGNNNDTNNNNNNNNNETNTNEPDEAVNSLYEFLFEQEQTIRKTRMITIHQNKSNSIFSKKNGNNAKNERRNSEKNEKKRMKKNGGITNASLAALFGSKKADFQRMHEMLETVKDANGMRKYLEYREKYRKKHEKSVYNYKGVVKEIASRTRFGTKKLNQKSDIMSDWTWQQVAKWTEKFEELSYMAGIFAEFRINGIELTLLKSEHFEILASMSYYLENITQTPDIYVFDDLRHKINEHRVSTIFKLQYQSIYERILKN